MMSSVVGYGHAGEKMGPRTGGHDVARVDSDHAECEGVFFSTPSSFPFVSWARTIKQLELAFLPWANTTKISSVPYGRYEPARDSAI